MEVADNELHRIAPTAIIYRHPVTADPGGAGSTPEYLILKRSPHKKVYPDRWTVPGGGIEVSDYVDSPKTTEDGWYYQVEKSLRREISEETGLRVGPLTYLLNMTFIRPDGIPVLVLSYYGPYQSGEVQLDDDSVEYAWVSAKAAAGYDLLPGIVEELEMIDLLLAGTDPASVTFPEKA